MPPVANTRTPAAIVTDRQALHDEAALIEANARQRLADLALECREVADVSANNADQWRLIASAIEAGMGRMRT